jgi:hypothetical protein
MFKEEEEKTSPRQRSNKAQSDRKESSVMSSDTLSSE